MTIVIDGKSIVDTLMIIFVWIPAAFIILLSVIAPKEKKKEGTK